MTGFLKAFGLMVGATGVAVALVLAAPAIFGIFDRRRRRRNERRKRELGRMLEGGPLEDILAASRYDYAHFQGEDGYRVFEKGSQNGFVGSAGTELDAHLWIAERFREGRTKAHPRPEGEIRCP